VSISPAFPISKDSVSRAIRQNCCPGGLALTLKLLVIQDKEECPVAEDGSARADRRLMTIDPRGNCRLPGAVHRRDRAVIAPCVGIQRRIPNGPYRGTMQRICS